MLHNSSLPSLRDPYHLIGVPVPDGHTRAELLLLSEIGAQVRHPGMAEARYLIQFPVTMTSAELISWLTEQFKLGPGRWSLIGEGEDGTTFSLKLEPIQHRIVKRHPPHILMRIIFRPESRQIP